MSPHCCGVFRTVPLAHALFHSDPSVVAKQPSGTPANTAPAANTSG